ncbi:MAG: TetR family transcriptional regulator [Candidatus Nanopelagicales bacterium]|jgi:AcrR family transcriptional regulator|nr:TetR family transcriptional regulator [Candidatus Nanopelagicales bacterium]
MTDAPDLEVRHRPVQARGRVRFEAILRAARDLLAERGVEGFTIDDVAVRADIPVGSVYQFFPNKFAIVAELDARDTQALVDDLVAAATRFPTEDWQAETNHIIDIVAKHWAEDPSRRAVWLAMRSTAVTRTAAAAHFRQLAALLEPIVAELTPHLPVERRLMVAEVIVEVSQSLLHFSVSDGQPRPAMVEELKRMLRAYLRAVALDA